MISRSEVADNRAQPAAWSSLEQPGVEVIGAEACRGDTIGTRLIRCGSKTRCDLCASPSSIFQLIHKYRTRTIEFCRMVSNNSGRNGDSRTMIKV